MVVTIRPRFCTECGLRLGSYGGTLGGVDPSPLTPRVCGRRFFFVQRLKLELTLGTRRKLHRESCDIISLLQDGNHLAIRNIVEEFVMGSAEVRFPRRQLCVSLQLIDCLFDRLGRSSAAPVLQRRMKSFLDQAA